MVFWFAHGFECLDHAPPAPWPHWLTGYFWPPKPRLSEARTASSTSTNGPIDGVIRCIREAKEQTRNNKLFWASHRMQERIRGGTVTTADARRLLTEAAKDAVLGEIEIEGTIKSAWGE